VNNLKNQHELNYEVDIHYHYAIECTNSISNTDYNYRRVHY